MNIPSEVSNVLDKLGESDKGIVLGFIDKLNSELKGFRGEEKSQEDNDAPAEAEEETPTDDNTDEPPFPPLYESGEDYDKCGDFKQEAADLKASGDWEGALAKYTEAVKCAPPSALLYANRALALLKLNRPKAAERDCDEALKANPDSAKALRIRGKARKELGNYEMALKDLSLSQSIDFDEGTVGDLKFLSEKRKEAELAEADKRNKEEEKLRKRAEEIKKAKEEAQREAEASARSSASMGGMGGMPGMGGMGGMPGMGGMGGMPGMGGMGGMPNMADIMSDPELMAAMQNPKVMAALQELMAGPGGPMGAMNNPEKIQELMSDPEVGPVIQKLMAKFGGAGAMPTGAPSAGDDDGIPNMDDVPDLDISDLPDLD